MSSDARTRRSVPADELLRLPRIARERAQLIFDRVGGRLLDTPSELDGWTRRTVLSHLRGVALEYHRMLAGLGSGAHTEMYRGSAARRRATLEWADDLPTVHVLDGWLQAINQLDRVATQIGAVELDAVAGHADGGSLTAAEVLNLWCTELQVHGSDLRIGLSPENWDEHWVRVALPMRIAHLARTRARHPASHQTDGGFQLLVTDLDDAWYVTADGPDVAVEPGTDMLADLGPTDVIAGTAIHLLQLLLGRTSPETFGRAWATAKRFREAFPGP